MKSILAFGFMIFLLASPLHARNIRIVNGDINTSYDTSQICRCWFAPAGEMGRWINAYCGHTVTPDYTISRCMSANGMGEPAKNREYN